MKVYPPLLQLAIRLLSTPTAELGPLLDTIAGLQAASDGDPGLLSEPTNEEAETDTPPWSFALERPPGFDGGVDVWIAGAPPVARASREALPRIRIAPDLVPNELRLARWFVHALRQRARTYERIVGGVLARRPALASATRASEVEPVAVRELTEALGIHESTIARAVGGCRFQTATGVWKLAAADKRIGIARA